MQNAKYAVILSQRALYEPDFLFCYFFPQTNFLQKKKYFAASIMLTVKMQEQLSPDHAKQSKAETKQGVPAEVVDYQLLAAIKRRQVVEAGRGVVGFLFLLLVHFL